MKKNSSISSKYILWLQMSKRALLFGVAVYVTSFFLYGLLSFLPSFENELYSYIVNWIITIPLILFWSKWYFQSVKPTWKQGLFIGGAAVIVGMFVDGLFFGLSLSSGESTEIFSALYTDWKFYVSLLEVVLITTYAGYEFDGPVVIKPKKRGKSSKKGKKALTKKKK